MEYSGLEKLVWAIGADGISGSARVRNCCASNLFILMSSCSFASMVDILGSSGGGVDSVGGVVQNA